MITGAARWDGAILVVAATDGPMPQNPRAHPPRAPGGSPLHGGLSPHKSTRSTIPSCFDLVELEVRELLTKTHFPGDDIPMCAAPR